MNANQNAKTETTRDEIAQCVHDAVSAVYAPEVIGMYPTRGSWAAADALIAGGFVTVSDDGPVYLPGAYNAAVPGKGVSGYVEASESERV